MAAAALPAGDRRRRVALVGASLACALSPLGLKTVLVEAVPPRAPAQPSYDDRTLALSASSCAIL